MRIDSDKNNLNFPQIKFHKFARALKQPVRANLGGPVNLRVRKILFRFGAHVCLYMREKG